MKKLFCTSIIIFCFSIFTFAQTSNLPCPNISVQGPSGLVSPGETITFLATVNGKTPDSNLEFEWTVSQGTIIDQQGKPETRVSTTEEMEGTNLKATVKIKGFSENCNNEASETAVMEAFPSHRGNQPYQYSNLSLEKEFATIDNFLVTLQNDRSSKGYILFEIEKTKELTVIKKRLTSVLDHIFKRRKFKRDLILYDVCYGEYNNTSLYVIPEGASLPEIPNCEKVDVDLK